MTTLDSCSGVEDSSSMGDNSNNSITTARRHLTDDGKKNEPVGGGDVELWEQFSENFQQVQSVLDQNRVLIQQVNENHQSKLPDNLTKNVALIKEINSNISTVTSLYSKLSASFANAFHQRREGGGGGGAGGQKNQSRRGQEA